MNKNLLKITGMAAVIAFTVACKDNQNEVDASAEEEVAVATVEAVTYNVDTQASNIAWVGSKPTEDHTGNISLSSGMVKVNGEELESGEFTIDMNSIEVTDLEGDKAASLKAHLTGEREGTSSDFFNTAMYPTAKFVVTGLNMTDGKAMLEGNLTLKDVTKNVSFPVTVAYDGDKMMLNSEEFTIDRTDWGIKYGSSSLADVVADKAISDDIKLTINLVATK
ncbi:polyisoprenoid-binding protein YceI [Nonlabens dokdonensis]|uniref:YCE I like family protein n=2 Tax=Nonlabens dokdonensis TaxID=328515 RepID=L7WEY9_NONDD|nr:YceI family protein [Nonlabens dokdonensis]AGC77448.1 YCE I like family protein [Nonlabens dokdonensis DSW-6]PZX40972.1 polyisoprenoid-binding protein YceI [Nonlabens dokdonensis]